MKKLLRRLALKILGISFTDTAIVNRLDGVVYLDEFRNMQRIIDVHKLEQVNRYTQKMEIVVVNLGNAMEGRL